MYVLFLIWPIKYFNQYFFFISIITERRPLKPQLPIPLFRSPSARLIQRDMLDDDRGNDGLNIGSLGGSNKEVHHYTFQPSKQIVSIEKYNLLTFINTHENVLDLYK